MLCNIGGGRSPPNKEKRRPGQEAAHLENITNGNNRNAKPYRAFENVAQPRDVASLIELRSYTGGSLSAVGARRLAARIESHWAEQDGGSVKTRIEATIVKGDVIFVIRSNLTSGLPPMSTLLGLAEP